MQNKGLPSSGILGIRQLLPALSSVGRSDVAYDILLKKDYPSWGFQVKHGATTVWERWNSWTPDEGFNGEMNAKMNSFNHYAFGAYGQYLFSNMAGIDFEGAGFKNIIIKPELGNGALTNVRGEYISVNGKITSSWKVEGSEYLLDVEIPVNTRARVYVLSKEGSSIEEGGRGIDGKSILSHGREGDYEVLEVGSGTYSFRSQI